jgi:hypothetical protein
MAASDATAGVEADVEKCLRAPVKDAGAPSLDFAQDK